MYAKFAVFESDSDEIWSTCFMNEYKMAKRQCHGTSKYEEMQTKIRSNLEKHIHLVRNVILVVFVILFGVLVFFVVFVVLGVAALSA